jgi:hypothetical protein
LLQPEADELNRLLQLDVDAGSPKEEPAFSLPSYSHFLCADLASKAKNP